MDGKAGTTLFLHEVSGIGASRVLLVGLGKQDAFNQKAYGEAVRAAWRALARHADRAGHVHAGAIAGARALGRLGRARRDPRAARTDLQVHADEEQAGQRGARAEAHCVQRQHRRRESRQAAARQGAALANGMDLTRDLGNLPPQRLHADLPREHREEARPKTGSSRSKCSGEKQMRSAQDGLVPVGRGAARTSRRSSSCCSYQGGAGKKAAPVVLVGKGITFDTGGISLKPGDGMDEMKFDMCGAGVGARHVARRRRAGPEAQRGRHHPGVREHARRATPPSRATSSRACPGRPSKC